MKHLIQLWKCVAVLALAVICPPAGRAQAADTLLWNSNRDQVSADIRSQELPRLLEQIAAATGWQVYLEPGIQHAVSAKFADLTQGQALRLLLGDLNFALVPRTNAVSRLYVFRTSRGNATQLILPGGPAAGKPNARVIPNELIVRLKPGVDIDELARKLGAKVIGRIPGLNLYRLQFPDQASAEAARALLADNPDVASVGYNYVIKAPPTALKLAAADLGPVRLKLTPPDGSGAPVVGLIDTAVQPLGDNLDSFLAKSLSVAGNANLDPNAPTHGTAMFESLLRAAEAAGGGSTSMRVISVDVYGSNPTTSSFDVAAGITLAVNNGANIINLSLGSPDDSQALHDVIQQAAQKGIAVFAAAGNNHSAELFYPAAYKEVTSVTAGSQGQLASYANYGSYINLIAPGQNVIYYGNTAYLVSGTSTATALVSGTVAATAAAKNAPILNVVSAIRNSPAFQFKPPQ